MTNLRSGRGTDSVSESLDKGLIHSAYGLIVLSPAFLRKKWTEYELKSLLTKEVEQGKKAIIPVWYNLDKETLAQRSLYLADKSALQASMGIPRLAWEITKTVRPDIVSHYTAVAAFRKMAETAPREKIPLGDLKKWEIVHDTLPPWVLITLKLYSSIFPDLFSFEQISDNFKRDYLIDDEYLSWAVISCAYIDVIRELNWPIDNEYKKAMTYFLVMLSLGVGESERENSSLPLEIQDRLARAYAVNAKMLYRIAKEDKP